MTLDIVNKYVHLNAGLINYHFDYS